MFSHPVLRSVLAASFLLLGAGCAAQTGPGESTDSSEDELRTTYSDLVSTLGEAELEQWIAARIALASGFDQICGDTICSGDFSNLTTVRISCSATTKAHKLKDCAWVLGGSMERVDTRTGKITTDARVFTCKIPVASSAKAMLATLSAAGSGALNAPLPGTGKSFYDGLVDCFAGVSGVATPDQTATFYADMADYSWNLGETEGLAFQAGRRNLHQGFDDICGDSFCEGDYGDISPLRLVCSVNNNSKRVARCSWSFAAADMSVDSKGAIVARTTTRTCNIEMGISASALSTLLNGDDPLYANIPGKTTSINDALIDCLP